MYRAVIDSFITVCRLIDMITESLGRCQQLFSRAPRGKHVESHDITTMHPFIVELI